MTALYHDIVHNIQPVCFLSLATNIERLFDRMAHRVHLSFVLSGIEQNKLFTMLDNIVHSLLGSLHALSSGRRPARRGGRAEDVPPG
jgi:hypothetical protein